MISQALLIINGKGGVLKTTISTNLAGLLAAAGYKVLLVELDSQENASRDLGVFGKVTDQGSALAAALTGRAQLSPVKDVRPGLDFVPGGEHLDELDADIDLEDALAPIADNYDVVIIDSPPGSKNLQMAALEATHFVVIPTRADAGSIDGLAKVARRFLDVRGGRNPDLDLLGVVLTDVGSQSRAVMREIREQVSELFGRDDVMFLTVIRHAEVPSKHSRQFGLLAHELDREAYASLRVGLPDGAGPGRFSPAAPGVAGDHQRLAAEITQRISERVGQQ